MTSQELTVTPQPEPPKKRGLQRMLAKRKQWMEIHRESGMATAEYAIAMIATVLTLIQVSETVDLSRYTAYRVLGN